MWPTRPLARRPRGAVQSGSMQGVGKRGTKEKKIIKLLRGRAFAALNSLDFGHMSGQCESMAPQYFQSFRSSLQGLLEAEMDNWHEASIGQETKAWPSPRDAPYALLQPL